LREVGRITPMPDFLPPDAVRFELQDRMPVLRLAVGAPTTLAAEEWSLLHRMTMCVVDGPGDSGCLIARIGPDGRDPAPKGWDKAVKKAAGSMVIFGTDPQAQGVFVRSVG
jgi:hypothetical protein